MRRVELGFLPGELPPLDGLFFYDAGLAWSHGQIGLRCRGRPSYDVTKDRDIRFAATASGLRLNLFNYAILRWDYAIPVDQDGHKGLWTWSLWPSF